MLLAVGNVFRLLLKGEFPVENTYWTSLYLDLLYDSSWLVLCLKCLQDVGDGN